MFPFIQRSLEARDAIARLGLIGLFACAFAGCSTPSQPHMTSHAESPSCSVPGHFCETFFGP
ncbi:hypothetical protein G3N95_05400 [Paraburkholderia sp. Tr-20389]|uniref:hypothetical protein n=1 Tax=Paraburkholderia sp. Tr-20389 TaxID=2703903 RepID=UPI0019805AAC|nr:hypothetical protein [Paraburkholderia sp. Tr-20389]MBN3752364.1 hypothetical protein [Paraburkholderia sp. Tr-20389]